MLFWIIIAVVLAGSGAWIAKILLATSARQADDHPDMAVYRAQLAEVDRDLERGVLSLEDAEHVRTEIARRILAANKRHAAPQATDITLQKRVMVVTLVVLGLGSVIGYTQLGANGLADLPQAKRIAQSDALRLARLSQDDAEKAYGLDTQTPAIDADEAFLKLIDRLRDAVEKNPTELEGLALLARNEALLGNGKAALDAQRNFVTLKGDKADAGDHSVLADLMITQAGGYVSKDAESALRAALTLNPNMPTARYYLGLYYTQIDRPDAALRIWDQLLRDTPSTAPWVPPIRAQILPLAEAAGFVRYQPPARFGEDTEMIEDMVARLSTRLASEGGTAEDWARLIQSYGVQGDTEQAATIWAEAQRQFSNIPDRLALIKEAAIAAGVAQ